MEPQLTQLKKPSWLTQWSIVGKTCIVTGANSGIGRITALELAKRGAGRVILACRNVQSGEEAAADIRRQLEECNGNQATGSVVRRMTELIVKHVDLASLKSVRQFANDIIANEPRLDVLVNNAGLLQQSNCRQMSEDGFELTFATNFLGPFLLTNMLLDLMRKSAPARIVMVTSQAYQAAWPRGYDVDDVNQHNYLQRHAGEFSYWRAYSQSKLAIILFTRALHDRLANDNKNGKNNSGVSIFCLHPGEIRTNITRYHSKLNFIRLYLALWGTDLKDGAAVPVYCACEPGIEKYSGKYFGKNCKVESVLALAKDDNKAHQLFQNCLEWTSLTHTQRN